MRFKSHHKAAETHLDTAADLVVAATEQVKLAAEYNGKAREAHESAIDYHTERLAEVKSRDGEIAQWSEFLEA